MNDLNALVDLAANLPSLQAPGNITRLLGNNNAGAKELKEAAEGFESVFLEKLLQEMRKTIPKSGLLDSPISDQMNDMFWSFLSKDLAKNGGIGLSGEVYRQMQNEMNSQTKPRALEQLL